MRVKEGWVLFWLFIGLLVAPIIVIVCELSLPSDYSHIKKYQMSSHASPLRFHLIGDFGDLDTTTPINNTEPVIVVAEVMQAKSLIRPISMIVSVGDNLYPDAYSEFQQTLFELMYKTFNIKGLKGKPWYLVLGNHDVAISSDYEIDADSLYPMWNLPDHNFTLNIALSDKYQVGFTFIDANILIGNDEGAANSLYT